jgi:mRNA interferase MazF
MMRRGDVVAIADRSGQFTGKPRPAVIVQSDFFEEIPTVTICPLTSVSADAPLTRVPVEPTDALPLTRRSWIMADKITTIRRDHVGQLIGKVSSEAMGRLDRSMAVFLGMG